MQQAELSYLELSVKTFFVSSSSHTSSKLFPSTFFFFSFLSLFSFFWGRKLHPLKLNNKHALPALLCSARDNIPLELVGEGKEGTFASKVAIGLYRKINWCFCLSGLLLLRVCVGQVFHCVRTFALYQGTLCIYIPLKTSWCYPYKQKGTFDWAR